ncbi:MAG: NAD(P)/FAD-dependent oxidoreductase [Thiohalomonadaceae bacterium]
MVEIVVAGAGIAGTLAAYAIRDRLGADTNITVVSDKDYFEFVPSNPWVAAGWRRFADVAFPIGPYLRERRIAFMPTGLQHLHPAENEVELGDRTRLRYDFLVLATGARGAVDEIPGLDPRQGHCHSVLRAEEAVQAHAAYRKFVTQPGPLVIGAMPGASVLGPLYELAFLFDTDLRRRGLRAQVPITLVTPEPYPGHLGLGQGRHHALEQALEGANIQCYCNAATTRIAAGSVQFNRHDDSGLVQDTLEIPSSYCIYWPRFRGIEPFMNDAGGLADENGLILVDRSLANRGYPNVFAAGLCVARPLLESTPLPVAPPESVFSIEAEIDAIARNILARIHGEAPVDAAVRRVQWIADRGATGAARLAGPQVPLDINTLRQGRWVHSAKLEFEKQFVNRIRLRPAAAHCPGGEIGTVASRLRAGQPVPETEAQAVLTELPVPLPRALFDDLRALAKTGQREPAELARELLAAAVQDTRHCLSDAFLADVEHIKSELRAAERPEARPGAEFEGGAP